MKKILLSLLALCCMTAAWAGTGDGSKDNPYSGEWSVKDLGDKLNVGDYLDYYCTISGTNDGDFIRVSDIILDKEIVPSFNQWSVGSPISVTDEPWDGYSQYCYYNNPNTRDGQMFYITAVSPIEGDVCGITIEGHYTGAYDDRGDGSLGNPFIGTWTMAELGKRLTTDVHFDYNCVITGGRIFVKDTKLNKEVVSGSDEWVVSDPIDSTPWEPYTYYCIQNIFEKRKLHIFTVTDLTLRDNGIININGYYTGKYESYRPGYVDVEDFEGFKKAIELDNSAKISLQNDIDIRTLKNTICNEFTGVIDGLDSVWVEGKDGQEGQMLRVNHMIYGGVGKERNACSWLFESLKGATIQNVTFSKIRVQDEENHNLGVIARKAEDTNFLDVTIDSCSVFCNKDNAGAVVGRAKGCNFQYVINRNCAVTVDGVAAGGLVGHSETSKYYMCMTSLGTCVFADGDISRAVAFSGGLIGYSDHDSLVCCLNAALVGADNSKDGGLVGESNYSDFLNCYNSGSVIQCDEKDFGKACSDRLKKLDELKVDGDDMFWKGLGVGTAAEGLFVGLLTTEAVMGGIGKIGWAVWGLHYSSTGVCTINIGMASMPFNVAATSIGVVSGAIAVVVVAATITASIMAGDDEVGGICGSAIGGTFEQCVNNGYLQCKDDNCGGIVGKGQGVTINNCLNTGELGWDEKSSTGAILGCAYEDESTGKLCKVTNCLTTWPFYIIGSWNDDDGMDKASGNNFRPRSEKSSYNSSLPYESLVDDYMLESGLVARWLNNGIDNRANNTMPWKQKLKAYYYKDWQDAPVLNNGDEVSLLKITGQNLISTPEELIAFRDKVNLCANANDKFAAACLINDIDMSGIDNWTPIGTENHPFRGTFDGRGFTIKNLKVSKSGSGYQGAGLFGVIDAFADINNVVIGAGSEIKSTVSGNDQGAAGVVGMIHAKNRWWGNIRINNCGNYANVTGTKYAAGVLGRVLIEYNDDMDAISPYFKIFVDSCYNAGTISASDGSSALLCGYTKDNAVVNKCWSTGVLLSTGNVNAYDTNDNGDREYFVGYDKNLDIKDCIAAVDMMLPNQKGVTKYSGDVASSGKLTYMLNGEDNNPDHQLRWKQELGIDAAPVSCKIHIGTDAETILANKGVSHSRSISAAQKPYGTLCLPYTIQANRNIEFFTFKEAVDDEGIISLCFMATDEVPAGTPVLYRAAVNSTYYFDDTMTEYSFTPKNSSEGSWRFNGTFGKQVFEGSTGKNKYFITNQDNEGETTAVIKHTNTLEVAPCRAYIEGPNIEDIIPSNSNKAKVVQIVITDRYGETTVINPAELDSLTNMEGWGESSYNLAGQKVSDSYRGMMIKNGKKFLKK